MVLRGRLRDPNVVLICSFPGPQFIQGFYWSSFAWFNQILLINLIACLGLSTVGNKAVLTPLTFFRLAVSNKQKVWIEGGWGRAKYPLTGITVYSVELVQFKDVIPVSHYIYTLFETLASLMFLGPLGGRERKIPVAPFSLGILGLVLLKMSTGLTLLPWWKASKLANEYIAAGMVPHTLRDVSGFMRKWHDVSQCQSFFWLSFDNGGGSNGHNIFCWHNIFLLT